MELDLRQFGVTLAVGVFVVFGVLSLAYTYLNFSVLPRLDGLVENRHVTGKVASGLLLMICVFICGIVGEDLSNKFVDTDPVGPLLKWLVKSESNLRTEVLFKSTSDKPVSSLSRELAASGRLSQLLNEKDTRLNAILIEDSILRGQGYGAKEPELSAVANGLYYVAKNTVFGTEPYSRELSSIQTRIDFARTLATYALTFFLVGLILFLVQFIAFLRGISLVPVKWLFDELSFSDQTPDETSYVKKVLWLRFFLAQISFAIIFIAGKVAFESEEREFDKRAFGYFATLSQDALPQIDSKRTTVPLAIEISGLAAASGSLALCVHDAKADLSPSHPRIGLIDPSPAGGHYQAVSVNWPVEELASDLESISIVPGRTDEYLVAESGYWKQRFGRVFRIYCKLNGTNSPSATILQTWRWPASTTDIEGIACAEVEGHYVLIAAKREGTLQWASLEFNETRDGVIQFDGQTNLPATWLPGFKRRITDLHLDSVNQLWASAAVDSADENKNWNKGPFRSVVYKLGDLTKEGAHPVRLLPDIANSLVLDGLKVEGLTSSILSNGWFTIGSDDEELGGVWRIIGNPPKVFR